MSFVSFSVNYYFSVMIINTNTMRYKISKMRLFFYETLLFFNFHKETSRFYVEFTPCFFIFLPFFRSFKNGLPSSNIPNKSTNKFRESINLIKQHLHIAKTEPFQNETLFRKAENVVLQPFCIV